ncbi:unnamed protein product, partial [Callosobruchus maculatus]
FLEAGSTHFADLFLEELTNSVRTCRLLACWQPNFWDSEIAEFYTQRKFFRPPYIQGFERTRAAPKIYPALNHSPPHKPLPPPILPKCPES